MSAKHLNSMTGSGRGHVSISGIEVTVDLRAVNNRFLDFQIKSDNAALLALNQKLRERLQDKIQRGKVECVISIGDRSAAALNVDQERVDAILKIAASVTAKFPDAVLNITDLLQFPGVINAGTDSAALNGAIEQAFDLAADELVKTRADEGARLADALLARLALIETQLDGIAAVLPKLTELERERLRQRIEDFRGSESFDPARLEQEVVLMAQRDDIQEEYDRLRSHVSEARKIISQGGVCGKRLDFMMQEFNRESNTIASKSSSLEITKTAVELKVLIEQLREQVQNIE